MLGVQPLRVLSLTLRDFRSYAETRVHFGEGLTVISGPNGAGKTNLLEGLYFGCTGRSCRTSNEREVVRWSAQATRVVVDFVAEDGPHETAVGFAPGQAKRFWIDGAVVERLLDAPIRPLLGVFMPDRLELVKGPPSLRRAHLDQLVAALWPSRQEARRAYGRALAQRNALIARVRAGAGSRASLLAWDAQLGQCGVELMRHRAAAAERITERAREIGSKLGLDQPLTVAYRPRSPAADGDQLAAELTERTERDIRRGFTGHGPHRDELTLALGDRDLRAYGSQGQQRVCLLALLLSEREAVGAERGAPPAMLLDDVMSELDRTRREALVDLLQTGGGQAILTTTDVEHVPGVLGPEVLHLAVAGGSVLEEAMA